MAYALRCIPEKLYIQLMDQKSVSPITTEQVVESKPHESNTLREGYEDNLTQLERNWITFDSKFQLSDGKST